MPEEVTATPAAPRSSVYSQAVKAGNTACVAGTTGVDVTTGEFAGPVVRDQASDVRPPRCVSNIGVDRPGLLVPIALVAVTG